MTKYYTNTFRAINEFLRDIANATLPDVVTVANWIRTIEPLVAALEPKIELVREQQKLLSKARGVGAARLGLRLAGINPRGPFSIPAENTAQGRYNTYSTAVEELGIAMVALLDAIQGETKDRNKRKPELEAITRLLATYGVRMPEPTQILLQRFRTDLYNYVYRLDGRPGKSDKTEPDPNSSYWPSSFIASSSSSSSLPPP
jgi:hypothetical protein